MTHRFLFASSVLGLALALPVAASAQHGGPIDVPNVPSNLTVEAGNVPYLHTRAYGTPRATWQHSHDGSAVWAKAVQPSTDPNFVAPGSIPWLLLVKVGTAEGSAAGRQAREREANRVRLRSISRAAAR